MPRTPRKISKNKVYHCMLRGINKQEIFFDSQDYLKFKKELNETKEFFSYKLYSYVLMPNHIHLEIKDENDKLAKIMQSLQLRYSSYFNKKYERTGHLFENRFKSKTVEGEIYKLNLVRYIHQNPVKSGISSNIDKYNWSSYNEYLKENEEKNKLTDTKEILEMFSLDNNDAKAQFILFNQENYKFKNSEELLEYEMKNNLTDDEIIYFVKEYLKIENIQKIQHYSSNFRDEIICKISKIKGVTQKQISRILGLNIRIIQRAVQKNKKI